MKGRRQSGTRAIVALALAGALTSLVACTVPDETGETGAHRSTSAPPGSDAPTTGGQTEARSPAPGSDAPSRPVPDDGAPAGLPAGRDTTVGSITDGDTFRTGEGERIRLIGIDTPEVSGGVECFGRQATAAITRLVPPGTPVRLVGDVEATDRYGRTLSYVYRRADSRFVNLALVTDGFATVLTIPPNVAHAEEFRRAAGDAREDARGLWSSCTDAAEPPPTTADPASPPPPPPPVAPQPVAPPAPPPTTPATPGCDPSYPTTCIPPGPPDLDCGDVPDRAFAVTGPDPHGFDGDDDGVGCES